jgi:hypothetical protein
VRAALEVAIVAVLVLVVLAGWRSPRARWLRRPVPGPPALWAIALAALLAFALLAHYR